MKNKLKFFYKIPKYWPDTQTDGRTDRQTDTHTHTYTQGQNNTSQPHPGGEVINNTSILIYIIP